MNTLSGLHHVIQYRRKETADWCGFDPWHSMAAFDAILAAEAYFAKQSSDMWEYRLIEISGDEE
jgi:hypothetical protein